MCINRSAVLLALLLLAPAAGAPLSSAAGQPGSSGEAVLEEARQLFDALEYEQALPALDRAIGLLEAAGQQPGADRMTILRAYEMRARSRFGLGDTQVSPRVIALLETVRKAAIGAVVLKIDPDDASVELAGRAITSSPEPLAFRAGEHVLKASRTGYRPIEERITIAPAETKEISLSMERVSAAVFLVTSPPDTEIVIDGTSHGRTVAGSLPAEYASTPERLGVAPGEVSQPLVLTDLTPGTHLVRFARECHVTEERQLVIGELADYRLEAVRLQPAVGEVVVESTPLGADVYVDGVSRGTAPVRLADVCEGERTIELRSRAGRFVRAIRVTAGASETVGGVLRPAFALLPSSDTAGEGTSELRKRVERALAGTQQIMLFTPPGTEIEAVMEEHPVPPEWLAFDAGGRPVGAAAAVSDAARRDLSAKLSEGLDVQGLAALTQPSASSPEMVVSLLAAGAGQPDVVPLLVDRLDSVTAALERIDFVPPLFRHALGITAIEVLDVSGLPVAAVDPEGPAARAGITPGEIVVKVESQRVVTVAEFERSLDRKARGDVVALEIADRSGATRSVQVAVATTPRLVAMSDRSILFNPLVVTLRTRLAAADPAERPFVHLNLAVALMRLGDYQGARDALRAVQLAPGAGISLGTQQYLLGLVHEALGDISAADQAWRSAAGAGGLLTEEGPEIKVLAERKLNRSATRP